MSLLKSVFIIGPGNIGWNVLELLIGKKYKVSALVRRVSHAEQIQGSGAMPIQGDLNDYDLIERHVLKNEIIIHAATADHLPSVQAVLAGIKQRVAAKKPTIYIHTSGAGVLDDNSLGAFKTNKIYHDTDPDSINALPDSAPHREIDLAILKASQELGDNAKFAIMMPPDIYGINPKHGRLSIQIPTIARFALKNGYAGHIGKGISVWSQVHVLDLARAYIVLLHHLESAPASVFRENPYFFCENGSEFSWKEAAEAISKSLQAKGLNQDASPREFSNEDWDDLFGEDTGSVLGGNSRNRAVRLRDLGWKPTEKGIWQSFDEDELDLILREEK